VGLAVSLWAEAILSDAEKEKLGVPLYSKDLDFRGVRFLAEGIKSWLTENGIASSNLTVATRENFEHMGKIYNFPFRPKGSSCAIRAAATIAILERLPLLDSGVEAPKRGTTLEVNKIRVLDPFSLVTCKLHAFHTRPEEEKGRDIHHLDILSTLLPKFAIKANESRIELKQEALNLREVLTNPDFPWPLGSESGKRVVASIQTCSKKLREKNEPAR